VPSAVFRGTFGVKDVSKCHNVTHQFLSARKADLKKGFQHLVVLVVVLVVVGTRVKKGF
jgi:hypothetical protein